MGFVLAKHDGGLHRRYVYKAGRMPDLETVEIQAFDKTDREYRPTLADLHRGISLNELRQIASWRAALRHAAQEDALWVWSAKVRQAGRQRGRGHPEGEVYEFHVLKHRAEVEAVMMLETAAHESRKRDQSVVYIEYLSVAPQNRKLGSAMPAYRHCGHHLLYKAVRRSRELGFGGGVGLHALLGAEGFYRRMGMSDYGPDPEADGLRYFECSTWPE